jgi:hypothetical protein
MQCQRSGSTLGRTSIVRWKTTQPDKTRGDLVLRTSQVSVLASVLTNSPFHYPVKPLVVSNWALLAVRRRYDVLIPLCSASEVQRMALVPSYSFSNCSLFPDWWQDLVGLPTQSCRWMTLRTRVKEQGEGNTQAISAVNRATPAFTSGEGVVNGEEERRSSGETQRLCADPPILGERFQPAQALRCLYNKSRRKIPNPHPIASHGYLQVILRSILRNLVPLCPAPNRLETPTHMFRIEINKWTWRGCVNPDGAKDANVHCAHEALAEKVEAVGWRIFSRLLGVWR